MEDKEILRTLEKEKPPFLYHASPNSNIEIFEPRAEHVRNRNEGPVIFATPDERYASMFLVPADGSWVSNGFIDGVPYIAITDKKRFERLDKGGKIYKFDSKDFENPPSPMGKYEWISKTPVKPLEGKVYRNGLDAMIEKSVQVYFITADQLIEFNRPDGHKLLKNILSENQKRKQNIILFP